MASGTWLGRRIYSLEADVKHVMVAGCGRVFERYYLDRTRWRGGAPFDASDIFNYEDHHFGVRSRVIGHRLLLAPILRPGPIPLTPGLAARKVERVAQAGMDRLDNIHWRLVEGLL
jgi:hypothetical protein